MSLAVRAVQRLAGALERRNAGGGSDDPWSIPAPGSALGQMSSAGTVVNADSALGLATFYRGVQLIADTIALTALHALRQDPNTGIRVQLVDKPPAIVSPFMAMSLEEGISQIITSLVMRGNAYLAAVSWGDAFRLEPTVWRILNPDQVQVQWDANGFRQYRVNGPVYPHQVTHLTGFMTPGDLIGAGVIEHCRNALGVGLALDDVAGEFFRNGIMSTGVIGTTQNLTPDDAKALAQQFQQNHSGVRRAHLPIVMGGDAKFTPISLSPDDAQFLQSRQFSQGEVATLLGIPPHLLGIVDRTTSWGTGIEIQGRAFVDYTLRPYLKRLETMFSSWMPAGTFAHFDRDELHRADTATRYGNWSKALTDGWLNTDEVRQREGLPPLPNGSGQVYRVPTLQRDASDARGLIVAAPPAPMPTPNPAADEPPAASNDDDQKSGGQ